MAVAASPRARSGAASRMHLRSRAKRLPHAHVCDGIEAAVSFQFQKIGQRSPAGVVHVHDDAAQRAPVPADRASVHLGCPVACWSNFPDVSCRIRLRPVSAANAAVRRDPGCSVGTRDQSVSARSRCSA
jgi:hypothetical protein